MHPRSVSEIAQAARLRGRNSRVTRLCQPLWKDVFVARKRLRLRNLSAVCIASSLSRKSESADFRLPNAESFDCALASFCPILSSTGWPSAATKLCTIPAISSPDPIPVDTMLAISLFQIVLIRSTGTNYKKRANTADPDIQALTPGRHTASTTTSPLPDTLICAFRAESLE